MINLIQAVPAELVGGFEFTSMESHSTEFDGGNGEGLITVEQGGNDVSQSSYSMESASGVQTDTGAPTYSFFRNTEGYSESDVFHFYSSESESYFNDNNIIGDGGENLFQAFITRELSSVNNYNWDGTGWTTDTVVESRDYQFVTYSGLDSDSNRTTSATQFSTDTTFMGSNSGVGDCYGVHPFEELVTITSAIFGDAATTVTTDYTIWSTDDMDFISLTTQVTSMTVTFTSAAYTRWTKENNKFFDPSWPYVLQTLVYAESNITQFESLYVVPNEVPIGSPTLWEDLYFPYGLEYTMFPEQSIETVIVFTKVESSDVGPTYTFSNMIGSHISDEPYAVPTVIAIQTTTVTVFTIGRLPMGISTYETTFEVTGGGTDYESINGSTISTDIAWDTVTATEMDITQILTDALFTWNDYDGFNFQYRPTYFNSRAGEHEIIRINELIVLTFAGDFNTRDQGRTITSYNSYPNVYWKESERQFVNLVPSYTKGYQIAPAIFGLGLSPVFEGVDADFAMPWSNAVSLLHEQTGFYKAVVGAAAATATTGVFIPYQFFYEGDDDHWTTGGSEFTSDGTIFRYSFDSSGTDLPMYLTTLLEGATDISQALTNHLYGLGGLESLYRSNATKPELDAGPVFGGLPKAGGSNTVVLWGNWFITDVVNEATYLSYMHSLLTPGENELSVVSTARVVQFYDEQIPQFDGGMVPALQPPIALPVYPDSTRFFA